MDQHSTRFEESVRALDRKVDEQAKARRAEANTQAVETNSLKDNELSQRISQVLAADSMGAVEGSTNFRQSMGGGEILRMILQDASQAKAAREQSRPRTQDGKAGVPPKPADLRQRHRPRDFSEID